MRGHKPLDENMRVAEAWPWTNPSYRIKLPVDLEKIASVEIDPEYQTADVNRNNNYFQVDKQKGNN
jgi:hypothetical protein